MSAIRFYFFFKKKSATGLSCLSEFKPQSTTDGKCCAASCLPVWLCLSRLRKAQVAREQATCGVPWAWLATVYVYGSIENSWNSNPPAAPLLRLRGCDVLVTAPNERANAGHKLVRI